MNDTDLDPIQLINSQETPNSNSDFSGQHICTNPFDEAFSKYTGANCETIYGEDLEQIDDKSVNRIETEKVESGFEPDDNDYDDQSMIDLCSDTKSIYDSDEKGNHFLILMNELILLSLFNCILFYFLKFFQKNLITF